MLKLKIGDGFKARVLGWKSPKALVFSRPLVLLQSDDWGRVGIRDGEGFEELRAAGLALGKRPYDFYSLENADDVCALHEMLLRHHDSTGRHPCVVMNFVVANVDFAKTLADGNLHLQSLADGLPGRWNRPRLFNSYQRGIEAGIFYPALHGTTHFCRAAVERELATNQEAAALLRTLWRSETPYIFWRMPWVGYEYWDSVANRFLDESQQESLIRESAELFRRMFGTPALSACAPGYRSNYGTCRAWERCGIRVVQNGSGGSVPIHIDRHEILQLYRNVDFEPATGGSAFSFEQCLRQAQQNLDRGVPAVVSVHAINFHSSLRDFRTPTLKLLDQLLTALEKQYPDILYVNDSDLYQMVVHGGYEALPRSLAVTETQGTQLTSGSRP